MSNSTHRVEVVPIVLKQHPKADLLSIVEVFGYTVIVRTKDWQNISQAAYLPPDSLVPISNPLFSFLATTTQHFYNSSSIRIFPKPTTTEEVYARVTVKKMRDIISYGLLVPAPKDSELGQDVSTNLNVLHYNPPELADTKGQATRGPNLYRVKYDVESFQRYAKEVFKPYEPVYVSEKIHGSSGLWVYNNGQFYCSSRTEYKKEYSYSDSKQNLWWQALDNTPALKDWLMRYPDHLVYGEVYGSVQNLKYGVDPGQVAIAVFDIMHNGKWLDILLARAISPHLPWVPTISAAFPFDFDELLKLSTGPSLIPGAKNIKEGIVVKPLQERTVDSIGRVQLKIISPDYLSMKHPDISSEKHLKPAQNLA